MGATPGPPARLPGRRERRLRGQVRAAWGVTIPPKRGLAPRRACSRRWSAASSQRALRHRREPGAVGGRPGTARAQLSRRARPSGGPGHLPDGDRADGRRRPARRRELVRVGGHRHQQRAARPARAQGARPARRGARRPRDHLRPRRALGPRLGRTRPPSRSGTRCAALAPDARRHELCAAGGAGRASSGRATTRTTRASCSCTAGSGRTRVHGPRAPFSPVEHEPPVERSTREFPIRLTTGRRLDSYNTGVQTGGYRSPAATRRDAGHLAGGRERARRGGRRAVRSTSRRGRVEVPVARRRGAAAGPGVHDAPLPGRGAPRTSSRSTPRTPSRAPPSSRPPRSASRSSAPSAGDGDCDLSAAYTWPVDLHARRPSRPPQRARGRRAVGDARPGPPRPVAAERAARTEATSPSAAQPTRGRTATCSCRRSTPCRPASAGSARARSTTSAAPRRAARGGLRRRDLLRLFATHAAAAGWSLHVCDDIACRLAGGGDLCADAGPSPRRRRASGRRPRDVAAQSLPRPVRAGAAPCCSRRASRGRATRRRDARRRGWASSRRLSTGGRSAGDAAELIARSSATSPHALRLRLLPRRPWSIPTSLDATAPRRLRGAAARLRARAGRRHPRDHGLQALGRGGAAFPTGPQVGGRGEQPRPPALPRLQRRRVRAGTFKDRVLHGGRPVRAWSRR